MFNHNYAWIQNIFYFYPQVECTAEKGVLRQLHFQGLPHVSFDEFKVFLSAAAPKIHGIAK